MEQPDPFDLLVPTRLGGRTGVRRLDTSANCSPESGRRGQEHHRVGAECVREQARGCVPTASVDGEQPVRRTLGHVEGRKRPGQPALAVVGDQNSGDVMGQ